MKLLFASVVLALAAAAQSAPDLRLFDYDAKAPLEFRDNGARDVGGIQVRDISYASPKAGRVPAYLVVPPGTGPFAGVIFVHWGQGNRSEFVSEALVLARAGAESLLIDGVFNRPGSAAEDFAHPEKEKQGYIQLVTDIRRGVDLLQARPEVDGKRIAYVGHSYGATWGGVLAGVEHRIRAHVLMGGLPQYGDLSDNTWIWEQVTKTYSKEAIRNYINSYAPLEPKNFVGLAPPSTVMFQFARYDRYITPGVAKIYWDAARQPKVQKWYDTSHEFTDPKALLDRDQFLEAQLKLKPVLPLILEQMGLKTGMGRVVGRALRAPQQRPLKSDPDQ
jgi:dienelactone hydrolase